MKNRIVARHRMVGRQLREAAAEGQFDTLPGAGEPLPRRTPGTDAMEEAGFRIMAEAGAVPKDISLCVDIAAQKARLAGLTNPSLRKAAMAGSPG